MRGTKKKREEKRKGQARAGKEEESRGSGMDRVVV